MVLFAIGVISEIVSTYSRKPLPSRAAVAGSMGAIGLLGMLAWMQNMFSASIPVSPFYQSPPHLNVIRFCFAKKDETLIEAAAKLRQFKGGA